MGETGRSGGGGGEVVAVEQVDVVPNEPAGPLDIGVVDGGSRPELIRGPLVRSLTGEFGQNSRFCNAAKLVRANTMPISRRTTATAINTILIVPAPWAPRTAATTAQMRKKIAAKRLMGPNRPPN